MHLGTLSHANPPNLATLCRALPFVGASVASDIGAPSFAALAEADVEASDIFFHRFYNLSNVKTKREEVSSGRAANGFFLFTLAANHQRSPCLSYAHGARYRGT